MARKPSRQGAQPRKAPQGRRQAEARTNALVGGAVAVFAVLLVGLLAVVALGGGAPRSEATSGSPSADQVAFSSPGPGATSATEAVPARSEAPTPAAAPVVREPAASASEAVVRKSAAKATPKTEPDPAPSPSAPEAQRFEIGIGAQGYEPSVVTATAGRPVTLVVAKGEGCAAGFLMPSLGVDADNSQGPATVKLGKLAPGTYRFTCSMGMVEGKLVVR